MIKKHVKPNQSQTNDYFQEYFEIFSILRINSENIKHEWNKEGDIIKDFNLYEDHPTPILTQNTNNLI